MQNYDFKTLQDADAAFAQAEQLLEQAQYLPSIELLKGLLDTYHQHEAWEKYIVCLNQIGYAYIKVSQLQESLIFLKKALDFALSKLGNIHGQVARAYMYLGLYHSMQSEFPIALAHLQKALDTTLNLKKTNSKLLSKVYTYLGWYYSYLQDINTALHFYNKSLLVNRKNHSENSYEIALDYNNIATCYGNKGHYDKALTYFQKAANIWQTQSTKNSYGLALVNTGFCFHMKGDYIQALHFYQESLTVSKEVLGENHYNIALGYCNVGAVFYDTQQYEKALAYLHKGLDIYIIVHTEQNIRTATIINDIGDCYCIMKQHSLALEYYQRAYHIQKKILGENNAQLSSVLSSIGRNYYFMGQTDKAIECMEKALQGEIATLGEAHYTVAMSYMHLGNYHLQKKQIDKALSYLKKSICSNYPNYQNEDLYHFPPLKDYFTATQLLDSLKSYGSAFYVSYKQNPHITKLETAFHAYQLAVQLIGDASQSFKTDGSKLQLANTATAIYDQAIDIALQLHTTTLNPKYINFIFHCFEKSKASILLANIKNAKAQITAKIPQGLQEQEKDLSVELTYLDKCINQEQEKGEQTDQQKITQLRSQYFSYSQQYEHLIQQFETEYPEYYRLKYDISTASLLQIQTHLVTNAVLISYFVGEKAIYVFEISGYHHQPQTAAYQVHTVEKPADFDQVIQDFTEAIDDLSRKTYIHTAYQLYQLLLAPVLDKPHTPIDQLIIIPDAQLHYLPFEALLTQNVSPKQANYNDLPYLLKNYTISYHYSATLFCHTQSIETSPPSASDSFIGFAPVYATPAGTPQASQSNMRFGGTVLKELPFSEQEIIQIQQLFDRQKATTRILSHQEATKKNFQNLVKGHKYVHIAAHGLLNHQQPELSGIVFAPTTEKSESEDPILYIKQAFHLDLDADLVVLSCCESGIGKLANGEGIIAMNRGLLYSGAKNVIYTLFKVYDQASAQLTFLLFKGILEKKLPYAEALRAAKLALLKQDGVTPKSWAGFVLLGR